MQDRFKFRCWHNKIMHYTDFIITPTGYIAKLCQENDYMMKFNQEDFELDEHAKVMQCTGLKDKNGELIFEGDICRNIKNNDIFSVCWHGTMAGFVWLKPKYAHLFDFGALFRVYDKYEVVGNIYENPELLNN